MSGRLEAADFNMARLVMSNPSLSSLLQALREEQRQSIERATTAADMKDYYVNRIVGSPTVGEGICELSGDLWDFRDRLRAVTDKIDAVNRRMQSMEDRIKLVEDGLTVRMASIEDLMRLTLREIKVSPVRRGRGDN